MCKAKGEREKMMKKCNHCGELVGDSVTKCFHCGEAIPLTKKIHVPIDAENAENL